MANEKLIEIKLPKCTLFLTHGEIQQLLKHDPEIWKNALKRGKYILRSSKQGDREIKKALEQG